MPMLRLRLFGDFSATSADGNNVTPKSKKAVGLLALLATSDTSLRHRRWLESKLWSDRAPEQASGSLRTTLVEIRKALGDASDALGSDRTSVWLSQDNITTDLLNTDTDRDFLEGLDIADAEFNDWLMQQRMTQNHTDTANTTPVAISGRLAIQCGEPWARTSPDNIVSQIVNDHVGKIISDFIASSRCTISDTNADLVIRTSIHEQSDGSTIFVQVIDPVKDVIVHSDHCFAEDLTAFLRDQEKLGQFCWNLADLALEKLQFSGPNGGAMSVRSSFVQTALGDIQQ